MAGKAGNNPWAGQRRTPSKWRDMLEARVRRISSKKPEEDLLIAATEIEHIAQAYKAQILRER